MSPLDLESARHELLPTREQLKFMGFPESDYGDDDMYDSVPKPRERIDKLLLNPDNEKARQIMFRNVREFEGILAKEPDGTKDFDIVIQNLIEKIARKSAIANNQGAAQIKVLNFIDRLGEKGGLFDHTKESCRAVMSLARGIAEKIEGKRGLLLTPRQFLLMEFVAKTHDLCKLLGGLNAQIDPDHEVIYKNIIGKNLLGKSFCSSAGEIAFTEQDVDFCVGIAGFHEDIWREEYFSKDVDSLRVRIDPSKREDLPIAVKRGRMLFHILDIFGDAVIFDKNHRLNIRDEQSFKDRFVDLFRRHIYLPLKGIGENKEQNWTRAKVYRPQWGLQGVTGMISTFEELTNGWGIEVEESFIRAVEDALVMVLQEAVSATKSFVDGDGRYQMVVGQGENSEDVRHQILFKRLMILADKQKLTTEIAIRREQKTQKTL